MKKLIDGIVLWYYIIYANIRFKQFEAFLILQKQEKGKKLTKREEKLLREVQEEEAKKRYLRSLEKIY